MTKNEVNILIQNPRNVLPENLLGLKNLAAKFPYCQAIQLLYAKILHKTKSIDYLTQLKYTAAITANRKVLYEIIMRQDLLDKISNLIIENDNQEQTEPLTVNEQQATNTAAQPHIHIPPDKHLTAEHIDYTDYTISNNNKNPATIADDYIFTAIEAEKISTVEKEQPSTIENKEPETNEQQIKENTKLIFSDLEKQILWEAVNAGIQIDVIKDIEQKPIIVAEEKTETPTQNLDFLSWLSVNNKQDTPLTAKDNKNNRAEIERLVDRFIQNEPKITPQKTAFFTPGNVAKLSITDNEDFVSETLAKIYEKQGYYAKAIKVYQKLTLKFPEKSAYFATRMEALNELKNKNK